MLLLCAHAVSDKRHTDKSFPESPETYLGFKISEIPWNVFLGITSVTILVSFVSDTDYVPDGISLRPAKWELGLLGIVSCLQTSKQQTNYTATILIRKFHLLLRASATKMVKNIMRIVL